MGSLFRENLCLLIGRAPDRAVLDDVEAAALGVPGVLRIHDLRAEYGTPDELHLAMHATIPRGTLIEDADVIAADVREAVHGVIAGSHCMIDLDADRS